MDNNGEKINIELKTHQHNLADWEKKDLLQNLPLWAERFNLEFKLELSVPAITVDQAGHTQVDPPPSSFFDVLAKYGIKPENITRPGLITITQEGQSKLKLWVCSCHPNPVKVRVAIQDFEALCLKCKSRFKPSQNTQIPQAEDANG